MNSTTTTIVLCAIIFVMIVFLIDYSEQYPYRNGGGYSNFGYGNNVGMMNRNGGGGTGYYDQNRMMGIGMGQQQSFGRGNYGGSMPMYGHGMTMMGFEQPESKIRILNREKRNARYNSETHQAPQIVPIMPYQSQNDDMDWFTMFLAMLLLPIRGLFGGVGRPM